VEAIFTVRVHAHVDFKPTFFLTCEYDTLTVLLLKTHYFKLSVNEHLNKSNLQDFSKTLGFLFFKFSMTVGTLYSNFPHATKQRVKGFKRPQTNFNC